MRGRGGGVEETRSPFGVMTLCGGLRLQGVGREKSGEVVGRGAGAGRSRRGRGGNAGSRVGVKVGSGY